MSSGVNIRPERIQDHDAISAILIKAFDQNDESLLVSALRSSSGFIPEISLVAEIDNKVVGTIIYSDIKIIDSDGYEFDSIALAPMAVDPVFQKTGIGSKLIRTSIDMARDLGYESIIVLGHAEYYPKFGFTEAAPMGIKAPFTVPSEALMVLELKKGALNEIQGTIKYDEAFSIL